MLKDIIVNYQKKNSMKRFSFILCLFLSLSVLSFGQDWDKLGDLKTRQQATQVGKYVQSTQFVSKTSSLNLEVPQVIWNEYQQGRSLYNGGVVTISVGCGLSALGGILYCSAILSPDSSKSAVVGGLVLSYLGSSLIGVSIPLLCWGDHLKRTANKDMELYSILK